MTTKTKYIIGGIGATIAVIGIGGYIYYRRQINELENIKTDIIGYQVQQLSLDNAVVDLSLKLTSTSNIEAKIKEFDLYLYAGEQQIAHITDVKKDPVLVPANGYSLAHVLVSFSPSAIFSKFPGLLQSYTTNGNLTIRVSGTANVKSAFITLKRLPIEYITTFNTFFGKINLPPIIQKISALI